MDEYKAFATSRLGEDISMPHAQVCCSIYQEILLPPGCSGSSYAASGTAISLAQHAHAELHLLKVIPGLAVAAGIELFSETVFLQETRNHAERQLAACVAAVVSKVIE